MDRQQMLEALNQVGFDTSTITDAVPDEVLAEILRGYEQQTDEGGEEQQPAQANADEGGTPEEPPPGVDTAAAMEKGVDAEAADQKMDDSQAPSRDDMIAALEQAGYDRSDLEAADDDTLKKEYEEVVSKMDDQPMPADQGQPAQDTGTTVMDGYAEGAKKMSEQVVVLKMSDVAGTIRSVVTQELKAALGHLDGRLKAVSADTARLARDSKIKSVRTFCESRRDQGKITPAMFDRVVARLLRADNTRLRKYSDGRKTVMKTELEIQMDEIDAQPSLLKFGEQFRAPASGSADGEVAKVKQHFEQFSERYKLNGITQDQLVKGYEIARKHDPELTAERHLGS